MHICAEPVSLAIQLADEVLGRFGLAPEALLLEPRSALMLLGLQLIGLDLQLSDALVELGNILLLVLALRSPPRSGLLVNLARGLQCRLRLPERPLCSAAQP